MVEPPWDEDSTSILQYESTVTGKAKDMFGAWSGLSGAAILGFGRQEMVGGIVGPRS
jgi:hypothetical protein